MCSARYITLCVYLFCVCVCACRLDEESRELERRRQRLCEQYYQQKRDSATLSLDSSGQLPSKKSSFDSTGSPVQHRPSPFLHQPRLSDLEEKERTHHEKVEEWWGEDRI